MAQALDKSWAIGIDLGTANTRVAVFRNDKVEIIPDADGGLSMPSCVSFNKFGRLIGSPALGQFAFNPFNTVFGVKRLVGRRFTDAEVRADAKYFPFTLIENCGQPVIEVEYMGEMRTFTIVEALSMILYRAKENAEAYLGSPVHAAVIGIPPCFSTDHRNTILDAATVAGLKILHTMPGPCAVATAYGQNPAILRPPIPRNGERNVVIFDLGAGTFNTALATIEEGIIEIKAIASDDHLGGEDFVNRLVNDRVYTIKRLWKKDITVDSRALRRLRTACETAIRQLSSTSEAYISIDSLYEGLDFHSIISRARFEELCQDLFRCTLEPVERVLREAKVDKSSVHEILLVGGSSRIPRVQQILSSYFNGKDLNKTMNPDEGEVSGLAITAADYAGETSNPSLNDILTLEVLPISIGVETAGGVMTQVIRRNTTVPAKRSEILFLNGKAKFLSIYEGERARAKDNKLLAKVDLKPLHLSTSQEWVRVEGTIDVSRPKFEAWCTLTEKDGGRSVRVNLSLRGRLSDEELERMAADAVRYKMIDDAEAIRVSIRDDLDSRIASVLESLSTLAPSAQAGNLLKSTREIREWADDSWLADVSEYRLQNRKLDEIEAAMIRELSERKALAESLQQVRQKLHSSTTTSASASILDEVNGMHAWLETVALAEPSEYSTRLERLGDILAELNIAKEPSGNSNDPKKTEPVLVEDQDSKKAKGGSQTAIQGMKGNADSSSQQPQAQHVPESLFSSGTARESFTDAQFERISTFLRNSGQAAWSKVPRLYTVLRLIDQLDAMESFIAQDITDIWFPFTPSTLPSTLQPSTWTSFLDAQQVVLSKGFRLEKGADRKHAHFSQDEPLPFQVIGRLGRGKHGSVDKVMSTISYREYARKVFKKTRGLRREAIKTFITELTILKRVDHRHCVELVS
jgi:L1 cell adhesion molecule like protein